uniref:Exosome component 2 n=1 Tax=Macaca mulatta TaxID=9544 RepID=A0A1D5QXZ6_MACMU
ETSSGAGGHNHYGHGIHAGPRNVYGRREAHCICCWLCGESKQVDLCESFENQLGQGVLVQVSPSLVKRQKTHFHDLPCGASVILGNNGFIWIYPTPEHKEEEAGGFIANLEPVSLADREVISRLRNCVISLVTQRMMLYDTSILYCYEASLPHQIKDILKPEIMEEIVMETRQRLLEQEG